MLLVNVKSQVVVPLHVWEGTSIKCGSRSQLPLTEVFRSFHSVPPVYAKVVPQIR